MSVSVTRGSALADLMVDALAAGPAEVERVRAQLLRLDPAKSLRSLLVQVIDPELLAAVLGPRHGPAWVQPLRALYERFRRMHPADWVDVVDAWEQQRRRWLPPAAAQSQSGTAAGADAVPGGAAVAARPYPGSGAGPGGLSRGAAPSAARAARRPALPSPPLPFAAVSRPRAAPFGRAVVLDDDEHLVSEGVDPVVPGVVSSDVELAPAVPAAPAGPVPVVRSGLSGRSSMPGGAGPRRPRRPVAAAAAQSGDGEGGGGGSGGAAPVAGFVAVVGTRRSAPAGASADSGAADDAASGAAGAPVGAEPLRSPAASDAVADPSAAASSIAASPASGADDVVAAGPVAVPVGAVDGRILEMLVEAMHASVQAVERVASLWVASGGDAAAWDLWVLPPVVLDRLRAVEREFVAAAR